MRSVRRVPVGEVIPPVSAVLRAQGIPSGTAPDGRIQHMADDAISIYRETAEPVGVLMDIGRDDFRAVFEGEGYNRENSPIGPIYETADSLALFAVTIGQRICNRIRSCFKQSDFALGAMLDSAASEGTEMTAQAIENIFRDALERSGQMNKQRGILRFSPGYCGWHISAQRKLFHHLQPEEIGITLNDSCLMSPIKSISGIAVMGRREIFIFRDDFPFCDECDTHPCRERMRSVFTQ